MIWMNWRFLFPFLGENIFTLSRLWVIFSLSELECSLFTWLWFEISLSCGRSGTDAPLLTSLWLNVPEHSACWDVKGHEQRIQLQHPHHPQLCSLGRFLSVSRLMPTGGCCAADPGARQLGYPVPLLCVGHPAALGSALSRRSHAAICRGGTAGTAFTAAPLRPEWRKCFQRSKLPPVFLFWNGCSLEVVVYIHIYIALFQCCHPHSNLESKKKATSKVVLVIEYNWMHW